MAALGSGSDLWRVNVGDAVQVAHDAVVAAARGVTGLSLPLWDLRVVPRAAIMTRDEYGLT